MFLNFLWWRNRGAATPTAAVLGGTFNPVHVGHLRMLDAVHAALRLDRMLLLPTAVPPHKRYEDLAPASDREAMLRAAIAGRESFEICSLEMDASKTSYTFDTLRELRRSPSQVEPVFIVGSDSLEQIHTWRNQRLLLEEFDLALVDRPRVELSTIRDRLSNAVADRIVPVPGSIAELRRVNPGRGGRIFHVPVAPMEVSSSKIRKMAAGNGNLDGLVPPAVAEYIQESGIYRQEKRH